MNKVSFWQRIIWKLQIRYEWFGNIVTKCWEFNWKVYEKTHPYGICVCNAFKCDYDSDFYNEGDVVQFMSYLHKQWDESKNYEGMLASKIEKAKRFRTKRQAFKEINKFEQKSAEIIGDVVEAEVCVF